MSEPVQNNVESKSSLDGVFAWVKSHERKILLAAVILQLGILISMIFVRATPLLTGDVILVRVMPVDPRDLFRGDYVILSYEFSRVSPSQIEGLPPVNQQNDQLSGKPVYVTLVPESDGKHWRAGKFSLTQPSGGKLLRGTLGRYGIIEYGIESYFVQEGQGKKYEEAIRSRNLSAEIAVTTDGQAALRRLVIE